MREQGVHDVGVLQRLCIPGPPLLGEDDAKGALRAVGVQDVLLALEVQDMRESGGAVGSEVLGGADECPFSVQARRPDPGSVTAERGALPHERQPSVERRQARPLIVETEGILAESAGPVGDRDRGVPGYAPVLTDFHVELPGRRGFAACRQGLEYDVLAALQRGMRRLQLRAAQLVGGSDEGREPAPCAPVARRAVFEGDGARAPGDLGVARSLRNQEKETAAAGAEQVRRTRGGGRPEALHLPEGRPLVEGLEDRRLPVGGGHGDEDPVRGIDRHGIDAGLVALRDARVVDRSEELCMRLPRNPVMGSGNRQVDVPVLRSVAECGLISCHARATSDPPTAELEEPTPCGTTTWGFSQYRLWVNPREAHRRRSAARRAAVPRVWTLLIGCSWRPKRGDPNCIKHYRHCDPAIPGESRGRLPDVETIQDAIKRA